MALSRQNCGLKNCIIRILIVVFLWIIPKGRADEACPRNSLTFEIITGFVYTAPDDTLELIPGTLHLTECLSYCRRNLTCQSVNFETGLCVLFSSSAKERPSALTASQFPVFTIYGHKICLKRVQPCGREWTFERVFSSELLDRSRKTLIAKSTIECIEFCLEEQEFECRSANYHKDTQQCVLNDADRHSVVPYRYFVPANERTEYLENNCVDQHTLICEFRKVNGKILKTVDAIFQDIKTLEGCRKKCLSTNYRCHSFDLGDPTNSVCRLSHLSSGSLTHIDDPYLEILGASTFEVASCYNVTIQCQSREMVAYVRTTKPFNGKVYARSRPNSCVTDVVNSLDFEIRMAYHDLNCDVKQQGTSEFSNDIVIQHHDMIVTNQDLGVTVHCQYDLTNKSIAHGVRMEVTNEVEEHSVHSVSVSSPNVTMKVTDRLGRDLSAAQVGDPLSLRFEITDPDSPYEIFVRELVAMDGLDNSEILLIDALGCPTDTLVMGAVSRVRRDSKILEAAFDAFKFPTSEIVQFKALVTPCLSSCEPVQCHVRSFDGASLRMESMGRKRRKRKAQDNAEGTRKDEELSAVHEEVDGEGTLSQRSSDDEVVVVKTIHITDKFGFEKDAILDRINDADEDSSESSGDDSSSSSTCLNMAGLVISCSLFLAAQLVVLLAYAFVWHKRTSKTKFVAGSTRSIDMIYNLRRENSCTEQYGIDNPYRSDITPYDTVYNLPRPHTRLY